MTNKDQNKKSRIIRTGVRERVARRMRYTTPEGPAIWTNPDPPDHYERPEIDMEALRKFLGFEKKEDDHDDEC